MNVTAVPASASAGRDTQYKPGAQATGLRSIGRDRFAWWTVFAATRSPPTCVEGFYERHRRPGVGSGWA